MNILVTKSIFRTAFVLLVVTAPLVVHAQQAPAKPPASPCVSLPQYNQLDFWVGEWDVKQPEKETGPSVGSSKIEKLMGSCVIQENWESQGFTGKSWNFYDQGMSKWRQIWIDVTGRKGEMSGEYRDGGMRLEGETIQPGGRKVKTRMVFLNLAAGKVRQTAERSTDEGKTWTTTVDFIYLKKS